jgi:hypothetical protein
MSSRRIRAVRTGKPRAVKSPRRKVILPKGGPSRLASKLSENIDDLPVGHPKRWLPWIGTLTHEEAEFIRAVVEERFEKTEEQD